MFCAVLKLLKVAVDCHKSGLLLPIRRYPAPVFVTENAPLNILLPAELSFVAPFFEEVTVPPKLQPLKYKVGLTVVIFPPNMDDGPKVKLAVPVRLRFCAVAPACVNCLSNSKPAEKPPAPTVIVFVAVRVAVAVIFPPQN